MQDVQINRQDLLAVLKDNRAKHKAEYEEAHAKWEEKALDRLTKWLKTTEKELDKVSKKIAKGKVLTQPLHEVDKYPLAKLPEPQSYEKDYNNAIAQVEMDSRDEITLDINTFRQWVQDEWAWAHETRLLNASYTGRSIK